MKLETATGLLNTARQVEAAAASLYEHFSVEMQRIGKAEVADTFQELVQHQKQRLEAIFEQAPTSVENNADLSEPLSQNIAVDFHADSGIDERYAMTPQQALNLAIHAENRNVNLYTQIAAQSEDSLVVELAERLANDALDQIRQLRLSRRRINRTRIATAYRRHVDALTRQARGPAGSRVALDHIVDTLAKRLRVIGAMENTKGHADSQAIVRAAEVVNAIFGDQAAKTEVPSPIEDKQFQEPVRTRAIADVEIAFDALMSVAEAGGEQNNQNRTLELAAALIPVFHILRTDPAD
jgi:hypothetical protein